MGFGLLFLIEQRGRSPTQAYRELIEDACRAERDGWDAVWLPEHHCGPYGGLVPSPALLGVAIASRTERIRIGSAASILSLNDPIRIAEDYALLDTLSGGRLEFGIGSGFLAQDFAGLGVPFSEKYDRFREGVETILRHWRLAPGAGGEEAEGGAALPPPHQRPHPPIWVAVSQRKESVVEAALHGFHLMVNPYPFSQEECDRVLAWYFESLPWKARSRARVLGHFYLHLAPSDAAARSEGREPFLAYLASMFRAMRASESSSEQLLAYWNTRYDGPDAEMMFFASPERVVERIRAWQARGVTDFAFSTDFGGLDRASVERTRELFVREVMPLVRGSG